MKLTDQQKELLIEELIKAGAKRREKPSKYGGKSLGKKGMPILEIRI